MSEWMPIETAPRDGTWIDLWVVPTNGARPGRFTDASWAAGAFRTPSFSSRPDAVGMEIVADITHWMPRPDPPTGASQ